MERSYYAVIPANVRYDKELQPNAKLLYGEITALCNERGYCWASNQYFADLYSASLPSVKRWINALVDKEYVFRKLVYKENSKEVEKRILTIDPGIKNDTGWYQKCTDPSIKNDTGGGIKNDTDNITYINNTFNNTKNIKKQTKKDVLQVVYDLQVSDELKEALVGFVDMRKQMKKPLTAVAVKRNISTLDKLAVDDGMKTEIVNQSLEHGWLTFYPLKTSTNDHEKTREERGYAF